MDDTRIVSLKRLFHDTDNVNDLQEVSDFFRTVDLDFEDEPTLLDVPMFHTHIGSSGYYANSEKSVDFSVCPGCEEGLPIEFESYIV